MNRISDGLDPDDQNSLKYIVAYIQFRTFRNEVPVSNELMYPIDLHFFMKELRFRN